MSRKLLVAIFICNLIPWIIGNGLLPLLPIYAIRLGATRSIAGYFMSFAFLSLAIGAPVAGWLSDRFQSRKLLLIIASTLGVPIIFLTSKATTVMQLALLTCSSWLFYGMSLALISTIAGIFTSEANRGKVFGLLGTTVGIGALIGGVLTGPLIGSIGYSSMFIVLSAISLILPVASLFLTDKILPRSTRNKPRPEKGSLRFGSTLIMLSVAHALAIIANGLGNMGRSLSMDSLDFSSTAITSTMTVSGLVLIPSGFLVGWLSDRIGRKVLMLLCYLSFAASLFILCFSRMLWHFWIVAGLMSIGFISNSVGSAMITDMSNPNRLGLNISLFQVMYWIGSLLGYAFSGIMMQHFGIARASLVGMASPVAAIIILALAVPSKGSARTQLVR